MKKKLNQKNIKKSIGKKEFIFDVCSLVIIIVILIYYGLRSNYYYTKLNKKNNISGDLETTLLSSNPIQSSGKGLHQDKKGYYFYGNVETNYIKYSNKLFRIVRINNDGSVVVVSSDNIANFMYNDNNYKNSNIYIWLNKIDSNINNNNYTGVYIDMLNDYKKNLVKTKYSIDKVTKDNKVSVSSEVNKDYVSIISISDYIKAGGAKSYLNIGKYFYALGQDSTGNNLIVDTDGGISTCGKTDIYGIRPVITFKNKMMIAGGSGSKDDPYLINSNNDNRSDQYVKLGNDNWKIIQDNDIILKLRLTDYVKSNESNLLHMYSDESSKYLINDKGSIAEYLNTTYYKTLSYADKLENCDNYVGEISTESSYNYLNIYNDTSFTKVSIPNLFDYNNDDVSLTGYPLINFTSNVSDEVYIYNNSGMVGKTPILNKNNVVPVVCIKKDKLSKGLGTFDNPYTIE